MIIHLPYPPTTGNHTTKRGKYGSYTDPAIMRYRWDVAVIARQQGAAKHLDGRLRVVAEIAPPDLRRRDLDNVWKVVADALTHAGIWLDDYQIDDVRLIRGAAVKGGSVAIFVEPIG